MQPANDILSEVIKDIQHLKKTEYFPKQIASAAAVVSAAAGDVVKTSLLLKYNIPEDPQQLQELKAQLRKQLIRTTAQTFRFIENL